MKIVLYVAELDIKGGTHKQVLRQAQYLKAQGHHVEVHTPVYEPKSTFSEFAELEVMTPGTAKKGRLYSALAVAQLAWKTPPADVIHVHDNRGLLYYFIVRALRRAPVIVWQINDLHPSFRIGNSSHAERKWRHGVGRWLNRRMAAGVDAITVNVGKNVDRVKQYLSREAHLFHCGVDLPNVDGSGAVPPVDRRKVLSTGVFFPFRNYDRLLQACGALNRERQTGLHVTIVGDTRYSPEYVAQVKQTARDEGIQLTILENLSEADLAREIHTACLFAFVNIDQSWGLSVFEAAAHGKPVVLSKSAGAAELLNGRPGFEMVDPESIQSISEGIARLADNAAYADEQGGRAQRVVQDMTWAAMYAAPVEKLFQALREAG